MKRCLASVADKRPESDGTVHGKGRQRSVRVMITKRPLQENDADDYFTQVPYIITGSV